jgi:hypothetical protein
MNQGFVNKAIKGLFNIIGSIKIKKSNTMSGNTQQPQVVQPVQQQQVVLGANTVIQFTVKGFIGTILSILGTFFTFYLLIVVPRAEKVEQYQKELMVQQQIEINKLFKPVNDGIGANNESIKALGLRFNDLDEAVEDLGNTSGGFGGNRSTASTQSAIDSTLVDD